MPTYNAKVVYPLGQDGPYTVPFPFLDEGHLVAEYDGLTEVPVYDSDNNQCTIANGPPTTTDLVIRRSTPKVPVVSFTDGSTIEQDDYNLSNLQWRYVTEELEDMFADVVVGAGGISIIAANSATGTAFPTGDIQDGFMFYKEDEGFKSYRWNGTVWEDVHKVLDLADFGMGIEPLRTVDTLPADNTDGNVVVYQGRIWAWDGAAWTNKVDADDIQGALTGDKIATGALDAGKFPADLRPIKIVNSLPADNSETSMVLLTTDWKTYRWNGTTFTRTVSVDDFDKQLTADSLATDSVTTGKISSGAINSDKILAGSITGDRIAADQIAAGHIQAGQITSDHIGTNLLITKSANIGDALIRDAHIETLDAGTIETGYFKTQYIAVGSELYDAAYSNRKFKAMTYGTKFAGDGDGVQEATDVHAFGTGDNWGFSHIAPFTVYTPGHTSGTPICARASDGTLLVSLHGRLWSWVTDHFEKYTGACTIYYKKASAPSDYYPLVSMNGGTAIADRFVYGVALNDSVSFYVAPCDANGDPNSSGLSLYYELDVTLHNWR